MQLLEGYCLLHDINMRTAYRWRREGRITTATMTDRRTYVLETQEEIEQYVLFASNQRMHVNEFKKLFNSKILIAAKNPERKKGIIEFIQSTVTRLGEAGIKIVGYDTKSIYRKIKNVSTPGLGAKALQRKERADKHIIRNVALSNNISKLLPLAAFLYFENAKPNVSQLVNYIQYYGKLNEEYYEFAAIPAATLKRTLTNEFRHSGYDNLHKFLNHHNTWRNTLPRVTGAFTDNLGFMDIVVGDDHKADVFKVFVWDQNAGKVVEKKVQIWTWCEEKTGFDLSHIIKVGEINSEDVLNSMVELIQFYGLPNIKFKVDNGIAKSDRIRTFMDRLDMPGATCEAVEAYTPTAKALRERTFGFYKNEFDSYFKNFIGPDKDRESRHSGRQLSPEETNTWYEDYKTALENYLTGFYAEVPRKRIINGEPRKISIREYFEENWQNHTINYVEDKRLRYALSKEERKRFTGQLQFKGQTFIPNEAQPVSFLNREYIIFYNPQDLSAVDLYAADALVDCESGEFFTRGQFVMTLNNTRKVNDPRQQVSNLKKDMEKGVKQIAEAMTSMKLKDEHFSPIQSVPSGEVINKRKEIKKRTQIMLSAEIDKIKISDEISLRPAEQETEETELHYSEDNLTTSLTYED